MHAARGDERVVLCWQCAGAAITSSVPWVLGRFDGNGLLTAISTLHANTNMARTCLISDWRDQPRSDNESQLSPRRAPPQSNLTTTESAAVALKTSAKHSTIRAY